LSASHHPESTVRALLERCFDYAGLFPPAALSMPAAWAEYLRHQEGDEAWLTGTFICPAARLPELAACDGLSARPLHLTLLAGRATVGDFHALLEHELKQWRHFSQGHALARLSAWELRLPADLLPGPGLMRLLEVTDALLPSACSISWEADFCWPLEEWHALAHDLRDLNAGMRRHGVKLRCGGLTAEDFPPSERVARIICLARDHGLALKCTAGLHHPLRHHRPELGVDMHGFLNVWGAAHVALRHGLAPEAVQILLEEKNATAFRLEKGGLQVGGHFVETEALQRQRALLSGHGSCSIAEPVEDLVALGWLPGTYLQQESNHER